MDDRSEICNLLYSYAELVDKGDGNAVAELFRDATVKWGSDAQETFGSEPILELFKNVIRLHDDGTPRTHHMVTNPIVKLSANGQSATCRSYYTVIQQTEKIALQVIAGGRYNDWLEKRDGAWRFTRREYFMDFRGNVSDHVRTLP